MSSTIYRKKVIMRHALIILALLAVTLAPLARSGNSSSKEFEGLVAADGSVTWVTKKVFGAHESVCPTVTLDGARVTREKVHSSTAIRYIGGPAKKVVVGVRASETRGPVTITVTNDRHESAYVSVSLYCPG